MGKEFDMLYVWELIDFYDNMQKSGTFQATSLTQAKRTATRASGIFARLWSTWYKTGRHWCRDNDLVGRKTKETLMFLVLKEVSDSS